MHRAKRSVQFPENSQTLGSDARFHNAAIILLPSARDESAVFKTIEEAGDVRIVRNHATTHFPAGQARWTRASQNSQNVELRTGEIERLEDFLDVPNKRPVKAYKVKKDLLLEGRRYGWRCCARRRYRSAWTS